MQLIRVLKTQARVYDSACSAWVSPLLALAFLFSNHNCQEHNVVRTVLHLLLHSFTVIIYFVNDGNCVSGDIF